jgi:multicomponent Na+:H+ antiporter subunit D
MIGVLFFIPMLSLGGIPPFSGFLGKLALFEAGANNGSGPTWVLIGCGALVSLLTLYALARAWSMIFWRDSEEVADYENPLTVLTEISGPTVVESVRTTPRIMVGATGAMVAVTVALTVFATPLFDLSARAGENIDGPGYYVTTVFPGGSE